MTVEDDRDLDEVRRVLTDNGLDLPAIRELLRQEDEASLPKIRADRRRVISARVRAFTERLKRAGATPDELAIAFQAVASELQVEENERRRKAKAQA
jgi:DNA-binding transcriptional MerR regulator